MHPFCRTRRPIGVGCISLLHDDERLVSKRNSDDASAEKLNMKVSLKQGDKDQNLRNENAEVLVLLRYRFATANVDRVTLEMI